MGVLNTLMGRFCSYPRFSTSAVDLGNLELTSRTAQPVFTIAIFDIDIDLLPNRLIWNQKLIIDSATIGDVLAGTWNLRICGPFGSPFPQNVASTPPKTLQDVYGTMGWGGISGPVIVMFSISIPIMHL